MHSGVNLADFDHYLGQEKGWRNFLISDDDQLDSENADAERLLIIIIIIIIIIIYDTYHK